MVCYNQCSFVRLLPDYIKPLITVFRIALSCDCKFKVRNLLDFFKAMKHSYTSLRKFGHVK